MSFHLFTRKFPSFKHRPGMCLYRSGNWSWSARETAVRAHWGPSAELLQRLRRRNFYSTCHRGTWQRRGCWPGGVCGCFFCELQIMDCITGPGRAGEASRWRCSRSSSCIWAYLGKNNSTSDVVVNADSRRGFEIEDRGWLESQRGLFDELVEAGDESFEESGLVLQDAAFSRH